MAIKMNHYRDEVWFEHRVIHRMVTANALKKGYSHVKLTSTGHRLSQQIHNNSFCFRNTKQINAQILLYALTSDPLFSYILIQYKESYIFLLNQCNLIHVHGVNGSPHIWDVPRSLLEDMYTRVTTS